MKHSRRTSDVCRWGAVMISLLAGGPWVTEGLPADFPPFDAGQDIERVKGPVRSVTITTNEARITLNFSASGALIEKTIKNRRAAVDEAGEQRLFRYNPDGTLSDELLADPDGAVIPLRRFSYSSRGLLIAEAAYHACRTFSSLDIRTYDQTDRLTENLRFEGRRLSKRAFQYGRSGKLEQVVTHRNGRPFSTTSYSYDADGRIREIRAERQDGIAGSLTSFQYDERGNAIVVAEITPRNPARDKTEILTYEYDSMGNWIRRTIIRVVNPLDEHGQPIEDPVEITERAIEYTGSSASPTGGNAAKE